MRTLATFALTLAALPLLDGHAQAGGYGNDVSASAQAGVGYAAPQQAIVQQEEVYTPPSTVVRERTVTEYVPQTRVIREEIPVAAQRTVILRDVTPACYSGSALRSPGGGCYNGGAALRSFAPVGYGGVQAQALAGVGYGAGAGVQNNVIVNRGLLGGRGLLGRRGKTVTKSRAVVKQR